MAKRECYAYLHADYVQNFFNYYSCTQQVSVRSGFYAAVFKSFYAGSRGFLINISFI